MPGKSCHPEHCSVDCCICLCWTELCGSGRRKVLPGHQLHCHVARTQTAPATAFRRDKKDCSTRDTPLSPPVNLLWILYPKKIHRPTCPRTESHCRSMQLLPGASSDCGMKKNIFLHCQLSAPPVQSQDRLTKLWLCV